MIYKNEKLIILYPFNIKKYHTVFSLPQKEISIDMPKFLAIKILRECNGYKTKSEIIDTFNKTKDGEVKKIFLNNLIKIKIICGVGSLSDNLWFFVSNPSKFFNVKTQQQSRCFAAKAQSRQSKNIGGKIFTTKSLMLGSLLKKRCSVRNFSSSRQVKQSVINYLIWSGYGLITDSENNKKNVSGKSLLLRHTIPSAGALYPNQLTLILLRRSDELDAGIYNISFPSIQKIQLSPVNKNIDTLASCFADSQFYNAAHGVIVISGSFNLCSQKYSNRSLLFVPLEAGHIAQNIHLASVEKHLGTLEVGAFMENRLKKILNLTTGFWPLTTIFFGYTKK